jgi:hypothetical protein
LDGYLSVAVDPVVGIAILATIDPGVVVEHGEHLRAAENPAMAASLGYLPDLERTFSLAALTPW